MSKSIKEKQKENEKIENNNEKQNKYKTKKIYNTINTKTKKIKRVKINSWSDVKQKCELLRVFLEGERKLHHNEIFGLSLNLIYIDGGEKRILETIGKYKDLYSTEKQEKWKREINYSKKCNYAPMNCEKFCVFASKCKHYKNLKNTVAPGNNIYELNNNDNYLDKKEGYKILVNEIKKVVY